MRYGLGTWRSVGDEVSQGEKRFEAMARNPVGDWRIADVELVCKAFGLACRPPSGGGSHYTLSHPDRPEILTIPARRPIKPVYIKSLVTYILGLTGSANDV